MHVIDTGVSDPVENLAVDAGLFDAIEDRRGSETLRFWEASRRAVVLGWFGRADAEVETTACDADSVPVVRRITGGGAVLVGAGCLNYSLVLSLDRRPALRDVASSYQLVLRWIADALALSGVALAGQSDLALHDRKIGGSAQRRGRRALLHHGTLLYAFEIAALDRYLKQPPRQPAYRAARPHSAFVTNAPVAPDRVKSALACRLAA